ncbi:hypothetical protein ACFO4E_21330 [Nocardiopsis mangrovi]|uniref:Uncharacterized protein n=1 Tax=Nocardiopsis mangrovi TaxID=1179818 RepID=A0ABV9E1Z1_9ACTN
MPLSPTSSWPPTTAPEATSAKPGRVLIAQQDDALARGPVTGWRARAAHRSLRWLVGYGCQSWRAVVGLCVVVGLAVLLGLGSGWVPIADGRAVAGRTEQTSDPGGACSVVERVGLGLHYGLPLVAPGMQSTCSLDTASRRGQVLTVAGWALQLGGWAFAILVVAGYTGLLRKT